MRRYLLRPRILCCGAYFVSASPARDSRDVQDVAIRFVQPLQFEFGGAYLDEADPAQTLMLDTGGPLARVRTTVTAGRVTTITLRSPACRRHVVEAKSAACCEAGAREKP